MHNAWRNKPRLAKKSIHVMQAWVGETVRHFSIRKHAVAEGVLCGAALTVPRPLLDQQQQQALLLASSLPTLSAAAA
jgi:hypothetical protein